MDRFNIEDILEVENLAGERAMLAARFGEIIYSSANIRVEVELLSAESGEFRVALQGTLDGALGAGAPEREAGGKPVPPAIEMAEAPEVTVARLRDEPGSLR
jgi:hypothetical protein